LRNFGFAIAFLVLRVYHLGMADMYGLDGQEISYEEWSKIFRSEDRFIAREYLTNLGLEVSTVWIGLSWELEKIPLIFETMVFPLERDHRWQDLGCWRWETRKDALEGHQSIVDGIIAGTVELAPIEYSNDELM
jgi:hypothetical protein